LRFWFRAPYRPQQTPPTSGDHLVGSIFNISTNSLCQVLELSMAKDKLLGNKMIVGENTNCKTLAIVRFSFLSIYISTI
jgi:hypothetical protein